MRRGPTTGTGRDSTLARFCVVVLCLAGPASTAAQETATRESLIGRAQVWSPTTISAMDMAAGPRRADGFPPGSTVTCDYVDKELDGNSRKFACRVGADDEVKVKFGDTNGEVHGEVVASRLFWALGFGADAMYPVRVLCRGCPESTGNVVQPSGERVVDPAVIERKMAGRELVVGGEGWSWLEIDLVKQDAGGAPRAHRDALKLLAVMVQHSDSKPEQQRLLCLDPEEGPSSGVACRRPFMMVNDLGLTFGQANVGNVNARASVNLQAWMNTPVWKGTEGCVGSLSKSYTGTLKDPAISEEGRRFLAGLLAQLSDAQLHDMFEAARVEQRPRSPGDAASPRASVEEWVDAFKRKRADIAERRCGADAWSSTALPTFETAPILWLQSHASTPMTVAANLVSLLGYSRVYMALALALALAYKLRAGLALLLLLALAGALTDATKAVVAFPRPDGVDSRVQSLSVFRGFEATSAMPDVDADDAYGFPSGHVAATTAFFFGLAFFFRWRLAWVLMMAAVPAMALSRMYLGRHFLGDVLGGIAIGVIATAIGLQALNLARLEQPSRGHKVARRMLIVAAGIAVCAMVLGLPAAYDAGRLLGCAVGVLLLLHLAGSSEEVPWRHGVQRIAIAVFAFATAWWSVSFALDSLGLPASRLRSLLSGSVPMALVILLPVYLSDRVSPTTRNQWPGAATRASG